MALDTTVGGETSDSYGTLAAFDAYLTAFGMSDGGVDDATKEQNLRRATVFLDRNYQFVGDRTFYAQALKWPRVVDDEDPDGYTIPSNAIPQAIIDAQFEIAAIYGLGTDLMAYTDGAEVKVEEVKAGPVSTRTEYRTGSEDRAPINSIGLLLSHYVIGGGPGAQTRVMRMARS